MSFIEDFKTFALKGNVVDMAVGIVIGVAFAKVVSSLVNDIIMPPIGMIIGNVPFNELKLVLKAATIDAAGKPVAEVAIRYGVFINALIEFLIIALTIFVVIKVMTHFMKQIPGLSKPAAAKEDTTE